MDHSGYDRALTNEYDPQLSVDDILAEFREDAPFSEQPSPAEDVPASGGSPWGPAAPASPAEAEAPEPAKGSVASMEAEALRYIASLEATDYAGLAEDRADAPEEAPAPGGEEAPEASGGRRGRETRRQRRKAAPSPWERGFPSLGGRKGRRGPEPVSPPEEESASSEEDEAPAFSEVDIRPTSLPYMAESAPSISAITQDSYNFSAIAEEARNFTAVPEEPEPEPPAPEEALPEEAFPDFDFDRRFRVDGVRQTISYNGRELDLSPEEGYNPPTARTVLSSYEEEADGAADSQPEPVAEEPREEAEEPPAERRRFRFSDLLPKKMARPVNAPPPDREEDAGISGYSDEEAPGYAPEGDYAGRAEEAEEAEPFPSGMALPSFKDYLQGLIMGLLYRMRGPSGQESAATVEEDNEDLGQELSAANASKYYGSFVHSLRLRLRICLVLLAAQLYLTLRIPAPGMLQSVCVASGMLLAIQFTVMLLCLDVVTGAVLNAFRRRFGADSMAVLACLVTSADALGVALGSFGSLHMPLCLLSSLTLTAALLSSLLSARGLRKTLRVPAIGKRSYTVTGEMGRIGREMTLIKSSRPASGFVRRVEEAAPDEALFARISPLILIAAVLLALIAALASRRFGDFLYVFSALLAPAVPLTALLSFSLPFFVGSMRIFSSGAGIAGWSGLCDIGRSRRLIVTDRDLFPEGSVELESVRVFANESIEKIVAYAGTMITASGSGVAGCFGELMEKYGCAMCHVENFEYLTGGGMKGVIDGSTVLCGSTDLMRLMNVRVPFKLVNRTTVLLAIDGTLYGIFNLNYTPQPQVRRALVSLMRSNRHPVFAVRDFNITPEMLHSSFDIATDGYDFPPYVERYAISEPKAGADSKVAAVVCREGLGPLTHMADTGRSMYVATRVNILITLLTVIIGMATVFIKLLSGGVGAPFLLAFLLAWALPVAAISVILRF